VVDESFGHDGAAGVFGAEHQDPGWFTCHDQKGRLALIPPFGPRLFIETI
jgi:hypothetical protein